MRMGVLTKYLIRVHVGPFLFAVTAITGLIFLNAVAQRIEGLVGKGLPWTVVVEFLVLSLPHTLALSLPMAVLVSVLYAFSDLTGANEITALSAGGVRPTRLLVPVLGMGAVVTSFMLYFNDQVLPESNHRLKNLLVDIGRKSPTLELREQVVNEIRTDRGLDTYFLIAARVDNRTATLEDVTIFDANTRTQRRTTYAERGTMAFNPTHTDLYLTLYDGVVHEVNQDRLGGFQRVYFDKQVVPMRGVGDELERRLGGGDRSDREMSFAMLRSHADSTARQLQEVLDENAERSTEAVRLALNLPEAADSATLEAFGMRRRAVQSISPGAAVSVLARDPVTQSVVVSNRANASRTEALEARVDQYRVELHKKWAIAFACLVFTLIGPPLALRFPRGGVGMVIGMSTGIFAIYWIGLIAGEALADRRIAEPIVAMWIANAIFLAVGLVLAARMGRAVGTVRGGSFEGVGTRLRRLLRRSPARARGAAT